MRREWHPNTWSDKQESKLCLTPPTCPAPTPNQTVTASDLLVLCGGTPGFTACRTVGDGKGVGDCCMVAGGGGSAFIVCVLCCVVRVVWCGVVCVCVCAFFFDVFFHC